MLNLSHSSVHNGEIIKPKYSEMESDVDERQYWTIWENKLQQIYYSDRIILLSLCCSVTSIAIVGNLLTLCVVSVRKQRLLFKSCLLSLALSDFIYAASVGSNYTSKLIFDIPSLWYLGAHLCYLIPFFQNTSLISGSMSLVAIAFDRYMAVFNKKKGQWQPGKMFCMIGLLSIWSLSIAISSPMLFNYKLFEYYIVPNLNPLEFYFGQFCLIDAHDKFTTLYYYAIIFTFVFLPLFVAFVCFNTVIAREIWKRRKAPGARKKRKNNADTDDSSAEALEAKISNETYMTSVRNNLSKDVSGQDLKSSSQQPRQQQIYIIPTPTMTNSDRCMERQRRQMRMFKVILILMCVFIVCRLPNWIFLFCKLNFTLQSRVMWLITYSLGILGVVNSMANPFLYTFLGETIRFTSHIRNACSKFCKLCRPKAENYANNESMCVENALNVPKAENGGVYLGN